MQNYSARLNHSIVSLKVDAIKKFFGIDDASILQKASTIKVVALEKIKVFSFSINRRYFLRELFLKLSKEERGVISQLDVIPNDGMVIVPMDSCEESPDIFD